MKISDIFVNCELKKSQLQLSPHINKVSKEARPSGTQTLSALLSPGKLLQPPSCQYCLQTQHYRNNRAVMSICHAVITACAPYDRTIPAQPRKKGGDERRQTRQDERWQGLQGRAIESILPFPPFARLLLVRPQAGWEWLWAGNKLLIDYYLNGGKRTDVTLLIPLHFYQLNSEYSVEHLWLRCWTSALHGCVCYVKGWTRKYWILDLDYTVEIRIFWCSWIINWPDLRSCAVQSSPHHSLYLIVLSPWQITPLSPSNLSPASLRFYVTIHHFLTASIIHYLRAILLIFLSPFPMKYSILSPSVCVCTVAVKPLVNVIFP